MKRIVIINQSTGYLTIDTANAYATRYDDVVLIAGRIADSERKLNDSIKVHSICAYNKKSALKRLMTWGIATIQILFLLLFKYRRHEIVYVTNPPMSYLCSLILKRPFSVIVYDTYPDALRNIGIKQGCWFYDMWSRWNRILFTKAKCVYTLSEGMAAQLTNYVERKQIKVVPLWSGSEKFRPIEKTVNQFALNYNLQDKFVVMYSGNMGYTHNVDALIKVADMLKEEEHIHFLLIGEGKKKEQMLKDIERMQLKNCTFLGYQPFDVLPFSLATADLAVVTLNEETALTSVPSKTFNLLAVGAPLLCIAPKISEIANLVKHYENGVVCGADEIKEMSLFILELSSNKEKKLSMSKNSLKASKDFTKYNAMMYLE